MLITCPECQKQISDKAYFCIHCGCPFFEIKIIKQNININDEIVENKTNSKKPIHTTVELQKESIQKTFNSELLINNSQVMQNNNTNLTEEDYKIEIKIYTVKDIQSKLSIGRKQAYELVNNGEFPAKRLGRKILIPIKTFDEWLYKQNGSK